MAPSDSRRTFLKGVGAAGVTATVGVRGVGAASSLLGDAFDLDGGRQEALVVFESRDDVDDLAGVDLPDGYHAFEVLPVAYTEADVPTLRTVASLDSVRAVRPNAELEYHNDDARAVTNAAAVQDGGGSLARGYDGSSVHAAVIDSGVSGLHPDMGNVVANYQWLGNPLGSPTLWADAAPGDTDTIGHGTHVSGSVAGTGSASGGTFRGMAPAADLTVYSAGATILVLKAVAAYDHLLSRVQSGATDATLVNNSYGSTGGDFAPDDPLNVATWEAKEAGLLSVFSAGNAGPSNGTLNQYAKAPHVLGVAATTDEKAVTSFSSRGRPDGNHDRPLALDNLAAYYDGGSLTRPVGCYRPGVAAPGNAVVSTMSPEDALGATSLDTRPFYAAISGTSMSAPVATGIAALVYDAYRKNNTGDAAPMDVLYTVAAEAEVVLSSYTAANVGAGFVDALDAAERAEAGNLAGAGDVTLA